MAKQIDEPMALDGGSGNALSWRDRLPSWRPRLAMPRLRWPALARWQLIALGVVVAYLVIWSGTTLGFSKTYSAQMFVTDSGAIGIPPPLETLDFGDVPRGAAIERKITIENDSPIPLRVFVFTWGDIRDLISIDDAFFRVGAGDEHTIVLEARGPASGEAKKYDGRVVVVQTPWLFPW